MKKLVCPECGKKLKLFEEIIDCGYKVQQWRCKKCKKEMYLAFDEANNIIKSRSFWADYYGKGREYLDSNNFGLLR